MSNPPFSKKIRVVFLIGELSLGGSEQQLSLLLRNLDKECFSFTVVALNQSQTAHLEQEIQSFGINVVVLPVDQQSVWQRVIFLYHLFRQLEPHIVHSWTVHDNPYAGFVGWLARVPVRWGSLRGSLKLADFSNLPRLYRWLSLHTVSRIVVNAESLHHELVEIGINTTRIIMLPNCVAIPEKISPANPMDYINNTEGPIVAIVGNLRQVKNHALFINGMEKIIMRYPQVRGVIIGAPYPGEANLPEMLSTQIAELGLIGKVILAGYNSNAAQLMGQFDIVCLTSYQEGTPNVLLEAMAAGKPVVATRVGGVPDLVQEGINGFLVDSNDIEVFVDAVCRLLEDPHLAAQMGQAGYSIIRSHHLCTTTASRLETLYQEAVRN